MDNLQKYMVQGMISEELMSEQNSSFVLTESGETIAVKPSSRPASAVHRLITESLLECCSPGAYGNSIVGKQVDPKIEKTKRLIQIVQDCMYRIADGYVGEDDSIAKTVKDACNPLIRTMIQQLYDIWVLNKDEKPAEEPAQPVPPAPEAPVLQLAFAQGESIVSPLKKEYVIEEVLETSLKLKDKATGARATVTKEIAAKWKK